MKILTVAPYLYPEAGGVESYAYNISKRMVERGFDVTILCSTRDGIDEKKDLDGIKVIRQRPNFILSNTPIRLDLFFTMSKLVKENDFDLINAHTPVPFYADVAAMVSKRYKIPFVLTYHAGSLMKNESFVDAVAKIYQHSIEKFALAQSDRLITVSEFVKNNYLTNHIKKVSIIPPGVDINKFRLLDKVNKTPNNILFVAQLSKGHKWKGLDYLLESIKLIKNIRDVKLTVVGSGAHVNHYKDKANELHIRDNVIFKGKVSDDELVKEYQKANIFILPSYSNAESFGIVNLEAMACGVPIVASKIGGIPDVVKDSKNGLLVPPKDPKVLSDAIIKLLNDGDLAKKMGGDGRKLVEEKYTWKKTAEMTENVYLGLAE